VFQKDLSDACHELVNHGVELLHMPVGIVSHIYNECYQIVTINDEMGLFIKGAIFPLNETYCRDVYYEDATIAITEIDGKPGMARHPLYVNLPVEAYISAPIHHAGAVWGTINFTSNQIRMPFSNDDLQLVESYAAKISCWLNELDTANWDSSAA
jgi:GAF domain-containing protein